jgi:hydroxyacylglutathione hydrolase
LQSRIRDVPGRGHEVWVHCTSGYRAAIAASLLDRAGRTVVAVNDDWKDAAAAASFHHLAELMGAHACLA